MCAHLSFGIQHSDSNMSSAFRSFNEIVKENVDNRNLAFYQNTEESIYSIRCVFELLLYLLPQENCILYIVHFDTSERTSKTNI